MWYKISSFVIKFRIAFLLIILSFTGFMAYKSKDLQIQYDYIQIVPPDDPEYAYYFKFKEQYGEDGNVFAIGLKDPSIFKLDKFTKLQEMCQTLKSYPGVKEVIAFPTLGYIYKDTSEKTFSIKPIFKDKYNSQAELDSAVRFAKNQKIYKGLLLNENTNAMLIAVAMDSEFLNSSKREQLVDDIINLANKYETELNTDLKYAGLPYIRSIMVSDLKTELITMMIFSVLVTCVILYLFFQSYSSVLFTFLVMVITITITGGTIVLLDYRVTILTGILPALIIIISIPNCIYMYNKYHQEFKRHKNKLKAVSRIIEKVGFLTFMTNINTAVGFFVLYFTDMTTIKEFGMSAGILSVAAFLISLIIIPTFLLFLPPPTEKELKHLDLQFLRKLNLLLESVTLNHRKWIYSITAILLAFSIYGITKVESVSYMVDDLPEDKNFLSDLAFFEQHFQGVMPLEIVVDLGKKKGVLKPSNMKKLEQFETYLASVKNVSPPLSILNVIKGSTQAFYNGDPNEYRLPTENERPFILSYFAKNQTTDNPLIRSVVDSTGRYVRFSCKVADLGTIKTGELVNNNIKLKAKEIFKDMDVQITGTTLLFLKGNKYLIDDLKESLFYSLLLISLMNALIFTNLKTIIISLIPNIIPMLVTAGIMGVFHITLKPSTALIFGISFGISIDNTIHYLSKYKQELVYYKGNVLLAVKKSIEEAGVSMMYTSVVLFSGFFIFVFSSFGGTKSLGILTSMTLFVAMFTNLTLLPALLLTFNKLSNETEEEFRKRKKEGRKLDTKSTEN